MHRENEVGELDMNSILSQSIVGRLTLKTPKANFRGLDQLELALSSKALDESSRLIEKVFACL